MNARLLFALGLFFCLTPWASPPLALLAGLIFGAISTHPYKAESRTLSKVLLQSAVVGLGFGMNLQEVVRAGRSGFLYTALGIAFAMIVGTLLGKLLSVQPRPAFLISTGHRNLRRQCDCGRGSNRRRNRRRDVGFAGHDFPAQLHRAADLPGHWPDAEAFAKPVRTVGGAGDPRHQLRGGSLGEIRRGGAGRGNDREAGARAVDCARVGRNGGGQRQQDAHSMAVVHPVLLPGGGGEHLLLPGAVAYQVSESTPAS